MAIKPFQKPIYVTSPFLPPLSAVCCGLSKIWKSRNLTNNGPFALSFEKKMAEFLGTNNLSLLSNGTSALEIGLQALGISGDVITTPFTFVATTNALVLNGLSPIFVDIEPSYYTIDPAQVEAAITQRTSAILAVHVYGHPCNIDALADIAKRYNLKLIFDSAHAFGVMFRNRNIAHYGDINVFSFHATKLFHSFEGGMLTFQQQELKQKFEYLKNHGFKNETELALTGTNAKMNEFQALIGQEVLKYVYNIIEKRSLIASLYRNLLGDIQGIKLTPRLPSDIAYNNAYMPIQIEKDEFGLDRDALARELKKWNIFVRKYFYPLTCDFKYYKNLSGRSRLPNARKISKRILTLPIYDSLKLSDVEKICNIIKIIYQKANSKIRFNKLDAK